jgi:hypothetical protein
MNYPKNPTRDGVTPGRWGFAADSYGRGHCESGGEGRMNANDECEIESGLWARELFGRNAQPFSTIGIVLYAILRGFDKAHPGASGAYVPALARMGRSVPSVAIGGVHGNDPAYARQSPTE